MPNKKESGTGEPQTSKEPLYDRALLLLGRKRNEVLTLSEVQRYGTDSFSDPDYIRLYGMTPPQWYAHGVRLLGRTAVECTRDPLANLIGRDVAAVAGSLPPETKFSVIDPFAGSCNTLYWILRHVPHSRGLAFEFDPSVYQLTRQNIADLDRPIELIQSDYNVVLDRLDLPTHDVLIVFVAPPWGTALDEIEGLDLRRTEPPITDIITRIAHAYPDRHILFAIQVYEKVNAGSMAELQTKVDWSTVKTYDLNAPGRNHGILLGTRGWRP